MLYEQARIFDHKQSSGASSCGGRGVADSLLKPQTFGVNGNGGIRGRTRHGAPEALRVHSNCSGCDGGGFAGSRVGDDEFLNAPGARTLGLLRALQQRIESLSLLNCNAGAIL